MKFTILTNSTRAGGAQQPYAAVAQVPHRFCSVDLIVNGEANPDTPRHATNGGDCAPAL